MAYHVEITKQARKDILRLPRVFQVRIFEIIASLANDPYSGKKLKGDLEGKYSVRVWPYRVIYRIYKKELIVSVIEAGHRGGVYR